MGVWLVDWCKICTLDKIYLALRSSKHSVGTNLDSVIQGLYRASTRARGQKQNSLPTLAAETEADRWREVAWYGVTVSSGRMVIVGCFDLHIARHIPPSAVKLPLYAIVVA
eukprot:scaffold5855_cov117-Isochrysis_galbana.AAC.8